MNLSASQQTEAAKAIQAYKNAMLQRKQEIKSRISELEGAVTNAFSDYCNMPYYLHAILIHDGTAESGHYYSYVYDRQLKVWWRLSDVNVEQENESVVMAEAFGGV